MSRCTSGRNRELDRLAECFQRERSSECIRDVEDAGYPFVGSGSNRVVFSIPETECVVKMSKGGAGNATTRTEVQVWRDAPENVRESLARIDETGENWVTMPEVDLSDQSGALREVREKMRETDWRCRDTNRGNVGHLGGTAVLFDYGEGCGESGIGEPF